MLDSEIIGLYFLRSEDAIAETDRAYGARLGRLAENVLQSREDAQECVNDTYLKAWDTIPPQYPQHLFAYLAKICRNFAFGVIDRANAMKRSARVVELTNEMELCVPDTLAEKQVETRELGRAISAFLETLSSENRVVFIKRYWFACSVADIAAQTGISEAGVRTRLHRVREKLRDYLDKEDYTI